MRVTLYDGVDESQLKFAAPASLQPELFVLCGKGRLWRGDVTPYKTRENIAPDTFLHHSLDIFG